VERLGGGYRGTQRDAYPRGNTPSIGTVRHSIMPGAQTLWLPRTHWFDTLNTIAIRYQMEASRLSGSQRLDAESKPKSCMYSNHRHALYYNM
jgi:hypothetical protein